MSSPVIIAAMAASFGMFSGAHASANKDIIFVGGDCSAAAERVVSKTGGQLLSARPKGTNCVVTVLVPSNDGGRPKKVTVNVPQ